MSREHLHAAADELDGLLEHTSGAPWRMSEPGTAGARYRALVATTPTAERRAQVERLAAVSDSPWNYTLEREVADYGGYLVAETCAAPDRLLMTVMRNAAEHLPDLLRAIAREDPIAVGQLARRMAVDLCPCDDHQTKERPR